MTSRRGKRARIVFNDKEEPLEVEEECPLMMWDLLFDMAAMPDAIYKEVFYAAPFLHGQGKARYDTIFFQRILGLSNKGYKLLELSNDNICNKSSFLDVWPMRHGRHYIHDCGDKVQAETYASMHLDCVGVWISTGQQHVGDNVLPCLPPSLPREEGRELDREG